MNVPPVMSCVFRVTIRRRYDVCVRWAEKSHRPFFSRVSLRGTGFQELPDVRQCQILTYLANMYDIVGRFVEAIEN